MWCLREIINGEADDVAADEVGGQSAEGQNGKKAVHVDAKLPAQKRASSRAD